ncbi:hypothetical protein BD324DRAFT_606802 [Kockovaella imperatae]|uniref:Uncharacterized protein n=1 Tax=Kockovaella imperatae TaxID=4999 RepID=A0A1Y1UT15_9TREE|nr:hypothetical protein BD324DRAFT_606802 [Kockovaella imperatae]ORX41158.1 hypothetical protein BD324DRAFT_606802 [Kockovaella imperatae]
MSSSSRNSLPISRTNTGLSHSSSMQTLSSSSIHDTPREHTTTLSHKLLNMFSSQPHAVFQATVTIHELANVPQLAGQFTVDWKFRGHKPKAKDLLATKSRVHSKPSLPNLKLSTISSSSASSLSVNSISTSTSATTTPGSPLPPAHSTSPHLPSTTGRLPPHPSKSLSLPPHATSSKSVHLPSPLHNSATPTTVTGRTVEKKASDPTPLRNSITPPPSSSGPVFVQSPTVLDEPKEDPELLNQKPRNGSLSSEGSSPGSTGTGSSGPRSPAQRIAASLQIPVVNASNTSPPSSSPLSGRQSRPSSALSTASSRLAASSSGVASPGARSGSTPTVAALVEPLPSSSMPPPPVPGHRRVSQRSTTESSVTCGDSPLDSTRRRTSSGPASNTKQQNSLGSSSHRKGETPAQILKSHTCTWDYEVEHTLRIPLTKSAIGSSSSSLKLGHAQSRAPVLGAGPMSESGMRLVIYQMPTAFATSGAHANGAKDTLTSALHAAHVANHQGDGKHGNPSEGRQGSQAETLKTAFGMVDFDLAPFAGKGPTTRRFLLRGSRTNATIKVSVEMKWLAGEERFVPPPLQEGHHVTAISDIVAHDAEDRIRTDLDLAKTPSNSSSASSFVSARTPSNSSSVEGSRQLSHVDLTETASSAPPSKHYGGLLQAADAERREVSGGSSHHHHHHHPHRQSSKTSSRSSSYNPSPADSSTHVPKATSSSVALDVPSHANRFPSTAQRHHHHRHHHHHIRDRPFVPRDKIEHFPAEFIIEAIFNPTAAKEETPFTYVPVEQQGLNLEGGLATLHKVIASAAAREETDGGSITTEDSNNRDGDGDNGACGKGAGRDKLGWGERMRQRRERKASRKLSRTGSTPPIAVD